MIYFTFADGPSRGDQSLISPPAPAPTTTTTTTEGRKHLPFVLIQGHQTQSSVLLDKDYNGTFSVFL